LNFAVYTASTGVTCPLPFRVYAPLAKPKKSSKGKKKAKKPEAKDLAMFDENAPSIFDDPLDALGP